MTLWLLGVLGVTNEASRAYAWWSGSGSVIIPLAVQLAIFGVVWWWHNQCGVHGCYWPSRQKTAAGERACWKHHPEPKRTVEDIHAAHRAAKTESGAR